MNAGLNWISAEPRHRLGADLLRKVFGIVIIYRILTSLRFATYLWGGAMGFTYLECQRCSEFPLGGW
jgi:hypothetical protein